MAGSDVRLKILVCGLNGAGKSTLGKALAERLGVPFLDAEDFCFSKTDPSDPYASPRTREEAEERLFETVKSLDGFVLSAVKGDLGERISPLFQYAVLLETPKEIRLRRVRDRSFRIFGERMLPGGDLFTREETFFDYVNSRQTDTAERWLRTVSCPVLRADGTKTAEENTKRIFSQISQIRNSYTPAQSMGMQGVDKNERHS